MLPPVTRQGLGVVGMNFLRGMRSVGGAVGRTAVHVGAGGAGRVAQGALYGAALGGLYGGISQRHSVGGGMLMGAGLGAGVGYAAKATQYARSGMKASTAVGQAARAEWVSAQHEGMRSARFIGRTGRRAVNRIRGLY